MITFALAGNQNSGKTTLFNQLTGSNQHVGNFPGVTVERKDGVIRGHRDAVVVDLPGIYALAPYTSEEIVTRDFITRQHPDGIINIVDATNIERNLYLSLQLIQLHIPMVIALNMMDEVTSNGGKVDTARMQKELGVPVVPISASRNQGIDRLIRAALLVAGTRARPSRSGFYDGPAGLALTDVTGMVAGAAEKEQIPAEFAAVKILENDTLMLKNLELPAGDAQAVETRIRRMEQELGTDRKAAIADMRYRFIDRLCADTVVKPAESKQHRRSVAIDKVLTNRYLAIPAFLGIMLLIFWLTFGVIGSFLSDELGAGISVLGTLAGTGLKAAGVHPVVISLVVDGVFAGVGSVLSFVPTIVILFFFLSLLEDSGYMARVAFVTDKLLRKIGLSGRSFVPMLIGFGCSVPAVMATRTLPSERDRKMTVFLIPFMSCSAKLPIYGMFTMAFFPRHRALVMIVLYVFGMLMGIVSALLSRRAIFRGDSDPFVMELPNYRLPSPKSVLLLLWDKTRDFLTRAFTIIFVATLVIWFLQKFGWGLRPVAESSRSILAGIGRFISPIFAPMGFGDWRVSTALLTGFMAKEAVISTFGVLTGASTAALPAALSHMLTPMAAFSFLIFTLIYSPCVAAISAIRRELNSDLAALGVVVYQTAFAWVCAFLVYQAGSLLIR